MNEALNFDVFFYDLATTPDRRVMTHPGEPCKRYISSIQTSALLTRMGEHVKCFVLGDTNQVDHPYLIAYNNGLNWIVAKFKGHRNNSHMVLKGSKPRGPITDLVLKTNL